MTAKARRGPAPNPSGKFTTEYGRLAAGGWRLADDFGNGNGNVYGVAGKA